MTDEAWVVHVTGVDDIHDMPDELAALREANALNKLNWQQRKRHEYDPICVAIAKPESEEWADALKAEDADREEAEIGINEEQERELDELHGKDGW